MSALYDLAVQTFQSDFIGQATAAFDTHLAPASWASWSGAGGKALHLDLVNRLIVVGDDRVSIMLRQRDDNGWDIITVRQDSGQWTPLTGEETGSKVRNLLELGAVLAGRG